MYAITKQSGLFGTQVDRTDYLGWQEPAWDEDGYFWTSKETIYEIHQEGNNTIGHQFLFKTEEQAKRLAVKLEIVDYGIEEL